MTEQAEKSKLLWACRRGMLELDTLFMPFANEAYDMLPATEQVIFQRLLSCEDPLLFSWFMGKKPCDDPDLSKMINAVLKHIKV